MKVAAPAWLERTGWVLVWLLVPRLGLALAAAAVVQIAGDLLILRRALREVVA